MMKYELESVTWEFTMGCNLRCRHCGSACAERLPDELTTEESLALADDIARLKPSQVSLSGGEPLLRDDWHIIAGRLRDNGIPTRMITNGILMDSDCVRRMQEAGFENISVSVDGTRDIHNAMRGTDCYDKAERAFAMLKKAEIPYSTNTTITKESIGRLPEIRDELVRMGVLCWQIQICLPEGNFARHRESVPDCRDLARLIDFAYEENLRGDIYVILAENIGYYTRKEVITRQIGQGSKELPVWAGCSAGIRSVGILHNGDITGCTSIRDKSFIEGNVRERPLPEVWADKNSFRWRRQLTAAELGGRCRTCVYGALCLGGCSETRLAINGSIYSENKYCAYNIAMKEQEQ